MRVRFACLVMFAALTLVAPSAHAQQPVRFSSPLYVDPGLGGGEPFVFADHIHHTLVYTSHEGTTHLYRPGLVTHQLSFFTHYRNQVNVWHSTDNGRTWQFSDFLGTGFTSNPTQNQGFSDPDLTQDASGRIYNTGIDLVNDALFSSGDGGKTWDSGTVYCHEGDRPWLAGGKANEVFMGTNPLSGGGHQIFQSTDGGQSCASTGISDPNGAGKLYYVKSKDMLVEPILQGNAALGVSTWHRGDAAFTEGPTISTKSPILAFFPAMAIDAADNVYLAWTPDERLGDGGGCTGAGTPQANSVMMAVSKDLGKSWSKPSVISHIPGRLALWPWLVAGDAGKVSIVWYQSDKMPDIDCEDSKISIYEAHITGATDPATMHVEVTNASGRPIGDSQICQGGTGCVATGGDRRLGDYFTNALDEQGCVMIASGDVIQRDGITGGKLPTSLPIFMHQTSGPALRGNHECSGGIVANVKKAACRDKAAPVSTIARKGARIGPRNLRVRGTARDRGCRKGKARASAGVVRVSVAVGREVGSGRCRFLLSGGSYSPARKCSRPLYVKARGTKEWHLDLVASFPSGRYQLTVRATDSRRNIERPGKHNKIKLRVS